MLSANVSTLPACQGSWPGVGVCSLHGFYFTMLIKICCLRGRHQLEGLLYPRWCCHCEQQRQAGKHDHEQQSQGIKQAMSILLVSFFSLIECQSKQHHESTPLTPSHR